jgi:hypothetical protein
VTFENDPNHIITTPMAFKTGSSDNELSGLSQDHVCKMIEESVQGCAKLYDHCFNEQEMR